MGRSALSRLAKSVSDQGRDDVKVGNWSDHAESRDPQVRRSGDAFLALVKNTYRVLLTRGLKGCYVFFQDEATRAFVRSRIE